MRTSSLNDAKFQNFVNKFWLSISSSFVKTSSTFVLDSPLLLSPAVDTILMILCFVTKTTKLIYN